MKKRLLTLLLAVLLLLALPTLALADGGMEPSSEFFTWAMLATYAGAVAATTLIVQLTKGIGVIDRLPTRIYSYIIAVVILIAAAFFTGTLTISQAGLCLINAVVVSLASNGAFDAMTVKRE